MLHLTNGDTTAALLRQTSLASLGPIVPWRDVLHWGPVRRHQTLQEQSRERAIFLAKATLLPFDQVHQSFKERDEAFQAEEAELTLWFEHDLYDQLQLLQVLSELNSVGRPRRIAPTKGSKRPTIQLVTLDDHPSVDNFRGLGQLSSSTLEALYSSRTPVTESCLATASRAWEAFTGPDPAAHAKLRTVQTRSLPFLQDAMRRWLEDYPWLEDGLSRTQRSILKTCIEASGDPGKMFLLSQQQEEAPFLGDSVFAAEAKALYNSTAPLLAIRGGSHTAPIAKPSQPSPQTVPAGVGSQDFFTCSWEVTALGQEVLAGRDWLSLAKPGRWMGGVDLDLTRVRYSPRRETLQ